METVVSRTREHADVVTFLEINDANRASLSPDCCRINNTRSSTPSPGATRTNRPRDRGTISTERSVKRPGSGTFAPPPAFKRIVCLVRTLRRLRLGITTRGLRGATVVACPFNYGERVEHRASYAQSTCLTFSIRAVNIWIISTWSVALWMTERSYSLESR